MSSLQSTPKCLLGHLSSESPRSVCAQRTSSVPSTKEAVNLIFLHFKSTNKPLQGDLTMKEWGETLQRSCTNLNHATVYAKSIYKRG